MLPIASNMRPSALCVMFTIAILACLTGKVVAFSAGAGELACQDLTPRHANNVPQTSPPPFQFELSQTLPDSYTVRLDANPGESIAYRGLLLQARAVGSSAAIGTFELGGRTDFRIYSCRESSIDGVTHTSRDSKNMPVTFQWTPPSTPGGFSGTVRFHVTVVREFTTFWTNIQSPPLQINAFINTRPAIVCPASFAVQSQGATVVPWDRPGCTDPDQDDATLSVTCSPMPNSVFPPGTRSVTCTCTDNQQLSDQCTFTVTVQGGGNQDPAITCPPNLAVPTLDGIQGAIVNYAIATCTDPDQNDATLTVNCSPATGGFFQGLGERPVNCNCQDNRGGSDSCQFTVTVTAVNTPPTIDCPDSFVVQAQGPTMVPWNRPGCTDPDQADATLLVSCSPMPNSVFPPGSRTVTCTCTDDQQASDQCQFNVTVQGGGGTNPCLGAPCGANECRVDNTRAGYTCHQVIGQGCP